MSKPEGMSVDKLYEHVIDECGDLLLQTLNTIELITFAIERNPKKAAELLSVAEELSLEFDMRQRYQNVLCAQWGIWRSQGPVGKKLTAKEARAALLDKLKGFEEWRKTLRKVEERL